MYRRTSDTGDRCRRRLAESAARQCLNGRSLFQCERSRLFHWGNGQTVGQWAEAGLLAVYWGVGVVCHRGNMGGSLGICNMQAGCINSAVSERHWGREPCISSAYRHFPAYRQNRSLDFLPLKLIGEHWRRVSAYPLTKPAYRLSSACWVGLFYAEKHEM